MRLSLTAVVLLLACVSLSAQPTGAPPPSQKLNFDLASTNQADVADFMTGHPVKVGLTLRFMHTPRGPRVLAALKEDSGAFVQLACPDSSCNVRVASASGAAEVSACYAEGHSTYQALKFDSSGALARALREPGEIRVSVPVLLGKDSQVVEFSFAPHAVPVAFDRVTDACEGDFWAQGR